ncbi:MAG: hypothetical protein WBK55_09630 [Alphaproteobacteria bacterium]
MKHFLIALVALSLSACSTPYQKKSSFNNIAGGYTELHLSPDTYMVTMQGNQHLEPESVFMMLFYRASEIAAQNNSRYFTIESFDSSAKLHNSVLPGWSSEQSSGTVTVNPYANTGNFNAQRSGIYMPPQTISGQEITMRVVIRLVADNSNIDKKKLIDGRFILDNWQVK